jgi:branched-chain amino acid transport system permease protein
MSVRSSLRRILPVWMAPLAPLVFVVVIAAVALVPVVFEVSPYLHNLITLTFMSIAAALAWNWLGGYVGQVSFGHAAMFGMGGFVAARIMIHTQVPFFAAWAVGGIVAGAYSLLWGHPTLRLRGPYFSIATIGVGEATRIVLTYWERFTGGASGLSLPINFELKHDLYWWGLGFLGLVVVGSYAIRKSRLGLALLAIKSDVDAAADVGVDPTFAQDLVLFLSGSVVGVAGGFYASFYGFIDPSDMFGFDRSISFLLMAVIGGVGTMFGPVLGALVFVLLQQYLIAHYRDLYLGVYGLLLVLVILFEPLGLAGLGLRIARGFGARFKPGIAAGGPSSGAAAPAPEGGAPEAAAPIASAEQKP